MLKGISPVISPELLCELSNMGHGDELIISDAFFPAYTVNNNVLRADGIPATELLEGILHLINADECVEEPFVMMEATKGDSFDPKVEKDYQKIIDTLSPHINKIGKIGRFEFYDRAKNAYLVVVSGEMRKYGNILIKKGVTPWK
ncbi:MAG: L-fucose mutarotase [Spirochaetia bacterium]|jgi:L-fucose mutarotase|nr:L-fucose mutarotase [Spirochaetia bacterium]